MDFLAISMVVLSLAVLGVLAFSLSRRSRVKKQLGRRWYQTWHEFHAFEMLEPSGKAAWVTSCNREYFEGVP